MTRRRAAVLGGGIAGMVTALRLAEGGRAVVLLEREPIPGGLAAGFRVGEAWLEKFYHHLFGTDRVMRRLIDEVGLSDRLVWGRPRTAVFTGGREWQLDSAASLLRFRPLPLAARLRMGAGLAVLRALPSPAPLEGRTAAAFLRRTMGRPAAETVWLPQLRAKFGGLAEEIAAPWFWARVHDRTARLGYLHGGFQLLYERLAERVVTAGGACRFGVEVTAIERRPDGSFRISTVPDGALEADDVVSTLPTRLTARLAAGLPETFVERYGAVRAYGAHCLILALDRRLSGSYWISILEPDFPFMALVEHTNWLPPSEYGGRHLVYVGNYRPIDDPLFAMSGDELVAAYAPFLARLNRAFDPSWIRERWSFAAPFAQPIVDLGFRERIPPAETPLRGLYLATMFQVYPHDRGQNYSAALAERLVRRMLGA